jgi:hypothetical protein
MSALEPSTPPPREPWRALVLAHVWLAVSMCVGRVIGSMPRTASIAGGTFATSPAGRALAVVTVLGGIVALVVVIVATYRLRRDVRALAMCAALAGALWSRKRFDAFDITYVCVVAIATALVLVRNGRGQSVDPRTRQIA